MSLDSKEFYNNLQQFQGKFLEAVQLVSQKKIDIVPNPLLDSSGLQQAYIKAVTDFTQNPAKFIQHNLEYAEQLTNLMFHMYSKINGNLDAPLFQHELKDKRFKNDNWDQSFYFSFIKQFYLMSSKWYRSLVKMLDVPEGEKKLLEFYTEQLLNAACPANYAGSNPEVINELISSNGQNLLQGIDNFIQDLKKSENLLNITTCKSEFFKFGENIAASEGKIVLQNELMQLIYYKPQKTTYSVPLLIIPPWINKFYIMDLSQENSFIKYLVEKGFEVFLVSWVNPDASHANKDFEDYLSDGILKPLDFLTQKLKFSKVNILGYCLGGTLLTCALAYLKSCGKENIVSSITYLTTLIDFSEPGELGLFINKHTIESIKTETSSKGFFSGKYMSYTFSLLRANDLIWSFVVNNYLLGKQPLAFDLLYWNADNTNLPASMHTYYLENMYIRNGLVSDEGINLLNTKINIKEIKSLPIFFLSTKEDHIAPWESTYIAAKLLKKENNVTFCLAGSGHIAGVINSATQNKYNYLTNDEIYDSSDDWLNNAKDNKGTWWHYWSDWLVNNSGDKSSSLKRYEDIKYVEKAPGSYVKMKVIDI